MNRRERLQRLEQRTGIDEESIVVTVGKDGAQTCMSCLRYEPHAHQVAHDCVVGTDGVARRLLPAGRSQECHEHGRRGQDVER